MLSTHFKDESQACFCKITILIMLNVGQIIKSVVTSVFCQLIKTSRQPSKLFSKTIMHLLICSVEPVSPSATQNTWSFQFELDFAHCPGIYDRRICHARLSPFINCLQISLSLSLRLSLLIKPVQWQSWQRIRSKVPRFLIHHYNSFFICSVFNSNALC